MPAETLHTTHQGPKPGETVTESGIILPAGVDRQKNVRETIQFDNLDSRSTKYNSAGVDPDNPYNAFASEAPQAEAAGPDFAADQPRRSRTNPESGAAEKLVKLSSGELKWLPVDQAPVFEKKTEQEARQGLHEKAIETVAIGIDDLEQSNEKQDEEIEALRQQVADQSEQIKKQSEQIDDLIKKIAALSALLENPTSNSEVKTPGKELELFNPEGSGAEEEIIDAEVVDDDQLEVLEGELEDAEGAVEQLETLEQENGSYELSPELTAALDKARNRYAQLTAKHRASIRGHYLQNSTKLIAIPGVRKLADWLGKKPDAEIETARSEYALALKNLQQDLVNQAREEYEESPELDAWLREETAALAIGNEEKLEAQIVNERLHNSGKISKLADWWVRQEGTSGKWKRGLIIAGAAAAGIGLGVLGGVSGIAALAAAGAAAGAGVGFGMSRNINKKRGGVGDARVVAPQAPREPGTEIATGNEAPDANVEVSNPQYQDGRVAAEQARDDIAAKKAYAAEQIRQGKEVDVDELTRLTEIRTGDEKQGNRARTMAFTGTAAGAGVVGAVGGTMLRDALDNAPVTKGAEEKVVEEKVVEEVAPPTPEFAGDDFDVQYGNGLTHEIQEFAAANGKEISGQRAYDIYKELLAERGQDGIIDTATYVMGDGDIGISSPGASGWQDGVGQNILDKLAARGL